MNISKIKWATWYDIQQDRFMIKADMPPDSLCFLWLDSRELRMRGRIASVVRRIQRALAKDLAQRTRDAGQ